MDILPKNLLKIVNDNEVNFREYKKLNSHIPENITGEHCYIMFLGLLEGKSFEDSIVWANSIKGTSLYKMLLNL